jgi:hypothetical protein
VRTAPGTLARRQSEEWEITCSEQQPALKEPSDTRRGYAHRGGVVRAASRLGGLVLAWVWAGWRLVVSAWLVV